MVGLLALVVVCVASSAPHQIHLALGHTPSEMTVSWTTDQEGAPLVAFGTSRSKLSMNATGRTTQYTQHCSGSRSPTYDYTSGFIHHTLLSGLSPSTVYYYQCGSGDDISPVYTFTTLSTVTTPKYPVIFGVLGDLGQTSDSLATVNHMMKDTTLQGILHCGDYSYADCDQKRWDVWADMVQPLAVKLPWMTSPGNHEIETDHKYNTTFTAYKHRFAMPEAAPTKDTTTAAQLLSDCTPSVYTGNYNFGNSFYSYDVPGAHIASMNTYTTTDAESAQYKWIQKDLAAVDRHTTPWIIVLMHGPWYNSNTKHYHESNTMAMRASMEALFYTYGVNLVISGHVHAYERTHPVLANQTNPMGPVYVNVGDGGNREGHCPNYYDTPSWSAYRNGDHFGHSRVTVQSAHTLRLQWFRNVDGEAVSADDVVIQNPHVSRAPVS